ncbi:TPA: Bro-N domain-containing protein [Haemophilus influenzae]
MNTQIQFSTFNFKDLPVRVISDPKGEFWFCGTDVCAILGYTNSRKALQDHCKQGGVTKRYTPTKSADQEMTFINEPNLYRLIIKSRKPGKYQLQPQQKTTVDDRTGLRNAVSFLVNKKGLIYSEVYQLIHQQFGVEHIDELSQEQLSQAIKYIHFLTLNLDGLFKKGEEVIIPEYIFDAIMKHAKLAQKLAEKVICYQEKQFALLGIARHYRSNELTSRANSLLSEFSYFLHEGEKLLAQQIENPSLTQIKNIF